MAITLYSRPLVKIAGNPSAAWLMAWVFLQAVLIIFVLVASAFDALTTTTVWIALLVIVATSLRWSKPRIELGKTVTFGSVLFSAFFAFQLFKCVFFQEFTLDAQTYGLPRLGLWMNYQSVLIHMPTEQINIFSNEWNGEINALLYGIAAGNVQGLMFGNLEIFLVAFLSICLLSRQLGASRQWSAMVAAVLSTAPVCLGVAGTLKGDLLAVPAVAMAASWIVIYCRKQTAVSAAMVIACCALAVGAKITAVFPAAMISIILVYLSIRGRSFLTLVNGALLSLVISLAFMSRYIANIFVYGTPLKRTANETVQAGVATFLDSSRFVARMFIRSSPDSGQQFGWLLAGGFGFSGILCAGLLIYQVKGKWIDGMRTALALGALAALGMACFMIPAPPWSFRYFVPSVIIGVTAIASISFRSKIAAIVLSVGAVLVIFMNSQYLIRVGEINANSSFGKSLQRAKHTSPVERIFLSYPPLRKEFGFGKIDIDGETPLTIAVHAFLNRPSGALVGSRAQNRLIYFSTERDLFEAVKAQCFDVIALTKFKPIPLENTARSALLENGYSIITDGELVSVSKRNVSCAVSTTTERS
ncbi:hypothetical protein GGQ73_001840 [Rhizobium skierniewicense]|uniref:Glycosyltransferase RgtA/B/C/D-like domain-containing protein n=1 Tax=Rhizobium skierniewicense TaxID=984260 RepID=A0A7W6G1P0_9HYPH|nr:hypothetical protein [Rhizobium skierniewicense]MBB3945905.1 hypothetical protein [Rhizobium skierniewicense]